MERIVHARFAHRIVLVPVDTRVIGWRVITEWNGRTVASVAVVPKMWQLAAFGHAVVPWLPADEIFLVWLYEKVGEPEIKMRIH